MRDKKAAATAKLAYLPDYIRNYVGTCDPDKLQLAEKYRAKASARFVYAARDVAEVLARNKPVPSKTLGEFINALRVIDDMIDVGCIRLIEKGDLSEPTPKKAEKVEAKTRPVARGTPPPKVGKAPVVRRRN